MSLYRFYNLKNNTFGDWKSDCNSDFEKLKEQRKLRDCMQILKSIDDIEEYKKTYDTYFSIEKRKGHEIHRLK